MSDKNDVEERILFNKRILVGKTKATSYSPKRWNVYLEAEIKERLRKKRDINLKPLKKYKTLSITGSSKYFGGQIQDELTDENIDFVVPKERVQQIKNIWNKWHLNDLHAGTKAQERALARVGGVNANKYNEQLEYLKKKKLQKDKGYKFGSDWLVDPLPNKVEKKLRDLF